jgi:hypothetical protein
MSRLLDQRRGLLRAALGVAALAAAPRSGLAAAPAVQTFEPASLAAITAAHRGQAFWLVLWDLECTYCMQSLQFLAAVQRRNPGLKVVTIATDGIDKGEAIAARLGKIGIRGPAYAFGPDQPEAALRHAIDPAWRGEKPRAYQYRADGSRRAVVGVLTQKELTQP